jgi:hypothetical protein
MTGNLNARHMRWQFTPIPHIITGKYPTKTPANFREIMDEKKFTAKDVKAFLKFYGLKSKGSDLRNRLFVLEYLGAIEPTPQTSD